MSRVRRTLVLVRHATTEQGNAGGDHARELLPAGRRDAAAAGHWLREEVGVPGLVLVSTAVRAGQTWADMADAAGLADAEVWTDRRLYNSEPSLLLDAVREVPEGVATVVLVGHAPSVPALAAGLADEDRSDVAAVRLLHAGFGTMTCAVLGADDDWADLAEGGARLRAVVTHRAGESGPGRGR